MNFTAGAQKVAVGSLTVSSFLLKSATLEKKPDCIEVDIDFRAKCVS
jgi:hypothetical protein